MTAALDQALALRGATVESASARSIRIRQAPTGAGFSKPRTDVTLVRRAEGDRFVAMLVDPELTYDGLDATIRAAFESAPITRNRRVVTLPDEVVEPLSAVKLVLRLLGNDPPEPTLLDRLCTPALAAHPGRVFGRDEQLRCASAMLTTAAPHILLLAGAGGVGKSAFLAELARRLAGWTIPVVYVPSLLAGTSSDGERERVLVRLLGEAARQPKLALAMDQIQWLAPLPFATGLLAPSALRIPLIGILPLGSVPWFRTNVRQCRILELHPIDLKSAAEAIDDCRAGLAARHEVAVPADCARIALERSLSMPGTLPESAIALLDLACARAVQTGAAEVGEIHILLAASDLENAQSADVEVAG
jgi:hypothetical protein